MGCDNGLSSGSAVWLVWMTIRPRVPWEESVPAFAERLHEAVKHVNDNYAYARLGYRCAT